MPEENNTLTEFVVSSTEIAGFNYGNKTLRIWESMRNKDNARLWQFRYDPLFIPEVKEDSQLAVESKVVGSGVWRTSLTIFIDTPDARKLAYAAVCKTYDKEANEIQPTNIFVLPIREVTIEIPDLQNLYPNARILDASFDFPAPATEFTIVIESESEQKAIALERDFPKMTIEYAFSFSARESKQNWVKFSMKTIKQSKLFVELNGQSSSYIHRDDLRKLLEHITNQVDFNAVIEKPENFEEGLLDKLLARWNTVESSSNFDEMKWQSTYNKDDLKPDVITKELNEMFTKQENEDQWKYNASFASSGKAGFLDILSAEASVQGSYSNEGLKKTLDEHNVKTEFEGNKIVAKSINVHQVNLSDFNQETDFLSVKTFVEPNEKVESKGFIELNRVVALKIIHPDLAYQVSQIRRTEVNLVGTVVAFAGEEVPETYLPCDGRPLKSEDFPELFRAIKTAHGNGVNNEGLEVGDFNVPDYRGMFLRGVDTTGKDPDLVSRAAAKTGGNTGGKVGSIQLDEVKSHNHEINDPGHYHAFDIFNNGHNGDGHPGQDFPNNGKEWTTKPSETGITIHHSGGNETRPKNAYVNYIIKAK